MGGRNKGLCLTHLSVETFLDPQEDHADRDSADHVYDNVSGVQAVSRIFRHIHESHIYCLTVMIITTGVSHLSWLAHYKISCHYFLKKTEIVSVKQAEQFSAARLTLLAASPWTWYEASLCSVLCEHWEQVVSCCYQGLPQGLPPHEHAQHSGG